ncbi:unnamed protein product [Brachionus calyciflorus]|uniref:Uncharacterized protein n=1 Tax=Brachionus calyciflorus TaxID=104777 RepID=A0A814P196_9BILA|nr:unnamed protein product [Brachionus calyciflorus]
MTGQPLKTFNGHQTTVLTLLAHRKLLYSTSSDHTARCWVMDFGDCTRVYKDHGHSVSCLIENNGLILTGCGDGMARCFDAKSGALKRTFKSHTGSVNCLRYVSNRLFTGSFDGTLKIWDATELVAEKSSLEVGKNSKSNLKGSRLTIENERSSTNHSRNTFERSDADSGFDDRDYRMSVPVRKVDVKELV